MTEYYILLQKILGAGNKRVKPLLKKFGSAAAIFSAEETALKACGMLTEKQIKAIKNADIGAASKILNSCKQSGITVISVCDKAYPKLLAAIDNPPLVLYAKGNIDLLGEPCICIVGPRKVSVYGKKAAFSLGARLAAGGFTVVSGGAVGADTAAHLGALSVSGNTICVFPSGLNSSYLKSNDKLREKIAQNGLLISEYPPETELFKGMIPIRNRIMSGLSLGTVVTEAPAKSGALITADMAAEQNRDVFIVPGRLADPYYEGSNQRIIDGAAALTDAHIIFGEYAALLGDKINPEKAFSTRVNMVESEHSAPQKAQKRETIPPKPEKPKNIVKNTTISLSKSAKIVYNNLNKQIFSFDEIRCSELSDSELLAAVTELEIKGLIKAIAGGRYEIK